MRRQKALWRTKMDENKEKLLNKQLLIRVICVNPRLILRGV
jgi:hypothetical protein